MNRLRQILVVTGLSFRTLHTRIKSSLFIVAGLLCVTGVMITVLSFAEGVERDYVNAGDPMHAMMLSLGAATESQSSIPRASLALIQDAPGIAKDAKGLTLLDAEIDSKVTPIRHSDHKEGYTRLRGVGPKGFEMIPGFKLLSGRLPQPGKQEVIAGKAAQEEFINLGLGQQLALPDGSKWPIVGVFSANNITGGYLIADSETLMAALKRKNYNSVIARLASPDSFDLMKKALTNNPALSVTVERQSDYWKRVFDSFPLNAVAIAYILGSLIAIGTVAGTAQTMYSAVIARQEEIAILRAIGFGGFAVSASIVLEAMLLACVGALTGTAIDWYFLNGVAFNGASGAFRAAVTPHLLLIAITWALTIAFVGALSPAIKASRVTVVEALRGG